MPETLAPEQPHETIELPFKHGAAELAHIVYQLWQRWANFELTIVKPSLPKFEPPHILTPEPLPGGGVEFVYTIHDHGNKFSTSKQEELFEAGLSMCKLHYTIEKIIALLIARIKESGVDGETEEVQVAFAGHESAQRKGFESVINLKENVVVINFEPGAWGERYLNIVKKWAERGFGYPKEAPRDVYRVSHGVSTPKP